MEPTITWLDLTASDRNKMQRVLDLFGEAGTVDELGLGTLRDALSDALFPGVTSIQTRLRYVFFIPWIYRMLESRRIPADRAAEQARQMEVRLMEPLAELDEWGVIGTSARHKLRRLPSSVYWSCLRRWGIFRHEGGSQSWYHSRFAQLREAAVHVDRADDPGVTWHGQANWHLRLPDTPEGFPDSADFVLRETEAKFLQGRIEETCAGTLLARLVSSPKQELAERFWEEPDAVGAGGGVADVVEIARQFSLQVEGMRLVYNYMLAQKRRDLFGDAEDWVASYSDACADWAHRLSNESEQFDPETLWALVAARGAPANNQQRVFVETWTTRVDRIGPEAMSEDELIQSKISDRERRLKGRHRARLENPNRLLDWSGASDVGRMDFNWFRVRTLLDELCGSLS